MVYSLKTPFGDVEVMVEGGVITQLRFKETCAPPLDWLQRRFDEYFSGKRKKFGVRLKFPDGVAGEVLRAVCRIPYGKTKTYDEIAREVGTSARAVGQILGANKLPILIPCHRVVAKDGLGGYTLGVERKAFLLKLEFT